MTVQKGGWDFFQDQELGVRENATVAAVSGELKGYPVTLADSNPATATAGLIEGAFKAVWWAPHGLTGPMVEGEAVLLGFSTTASDATDLGAILTSADTAITTPDGVGQPNILVYHLSDTERMKAIYDGTNTIKTVMVRGVGGVTGTPNGILWTIS